MEDPDVVIRQVIWHSLCASLFVLVLSLFLVCRLSSQSGHYNTRMGWKIGSVVHLVSCYALPMAGIMMLVLSFLNLCVGKR
jgi:hypothetical protein